jgi:cation diffusion facilitator family transporter
MRFTNKQLLRPVVCTAVGLVGNVLLTIVKLAIGFLSGSASLIADGFHSFSDLAGDIGVLIALKASTRPPDRNHPYGHHNYETLGGMAAAILLLGTGFLLARDAIVGFINHQQSSPTWIAFYVALGSILVKEVMARYAFIAGKIHNSPALRANAAHHRSDALSSIAAAIGIAGTIAGWYFMDGLAALLISVLILKMGWDLIQENSQILMDTMPSEEFVLKVTGYALAVDGVLAVNSLILRPRGSIYLGDISIAVNPDLTVTEGHEIAHLVEKQLQAHEHSLGGVMVHVEPHS